MIFWRTLLFVGLFLLLSGCNSNPTEPRELGYIDLMVRPYSFKIPVGALDGVTIMGSENNGLGVIFDRRNKTGRQRMLSIFAFYNPIFGYDIDMRKFPRLVLGLDELTSELGLSEIAQEDIRNTSRAIAQGRRANVMKIPGGIAYLLIDEQDGYVDGYLTADDNPQALNFISAKGISEKELKRIIFDNVYLDRGILGN